MAYEAVPFRRVAKFLSGGTPSKSRPEYWEGTIPWVSPKDMGEAQLDDATDHISIAATEGSATKLVGEGTILAVARSGILARKWPIALVRREVAFNQDIKAIVVDRNKVDPEYAFWWLRSCESDVLHRGVKKGATVHSLRANFLEALSIPLPPIEEQRRIVDILNRAASIERLRRQASAHLRDFIPALFLKMFGDPVENPMGWPTSALGDLLRSAQYGSSQKADAAEDAIPMLRMGNVTYDGYLDCRDLKHVDLPPEERDKYLLAEGDLLFNRTNSKELVGKTGMWDSRFPAIAASYFIRLRVDAALASPTYLWSFMNSSGMKARLLRMAKGAIGQANINAKELQAIPVPVPPLDKQEAFARLVEAAKARSQLADNASTLAVGLSRSLLDRMLGAGRS